MTSEPLSLDMKIGRNVGDEPMPEQAWRRFQNELVRLVAPLGNVVFVGVGLGYYLGQVEDTFAITVALSAPIDEIGLNADVALLAEKYGQDCITVSVTSPRFVGPVTAVAPAPPAA